MSKYVFTVLFMLCINVAGIVGQEKLTRKEHENAIKLAKAFEDEMISAKDVYSTSDKFFVKDFVSRHLGDKRNYALPNLDREIALTLGFADLRRYYISCMNFEFLTGIYSLNKNDSSREQVGSWESSYPSSVVDLVATIYPNGDYQKGSINGHRIQNESQLKSFVAVQDRISDRIRDILNTSFFKRNSLTYQKNIRDLKKIPGRALFSPFLSPCADCFGFPSGTRFIRINTAVFQLVLVSVEDRLLIVNVASD